MVDAGRKYISPSHFVANAGVDAKDNPNVGSNPTAPLGRDGKGGDERRHVCAIRCGRLDQSSLAVVRGYTDAASFNGGIEMDRTQRQTNDLLVDNLMARMVYVEGQNMWKLLGTISSGEMAALREVLFEYREKTRDLKDEMEWT